MELVEKSMNRNKVWCEVFLYTMPLHLICNSISPSIVHKSLFQQMSMSVETIWWSHDDDDDEVVLWSRVIQCRSCVYKGEIYKRRWNKNDLHSFTYKVMFSILFMNKKIFHLFNNKTIRWDIIDQRKSHYTWWIMMDQFWKLRQQSTNIHRTFNSLLILSYELVFVNNEHRACWRISFKLSSSWIWLNK